MHFSLVRRKILRLYFCRQRILPLIPHHSLNGVSPVETQNLASPVLPIAIYSFNNIFTIIAYTPLWDARFCVSTIAGSAYHPYTPHHSLNGVSPVETQNLASPVLLISINSCNNMLTIIAYTPSWDAKSCVSTFADSVGRMVFPDCHTIEYNTLFRKHHFHTAWF